MCDARQFALTAWASHFYQIIYMVSSTENTTSYAAGFHILSRLHLDAASSPTATLGASVKQVHSDWAKCIDNARKQCFPGSVRAADFRHMWAAVEEQLKSKLNPGNHEESGSRYHTIRKALWRSRTHCVTLTEFHHFWYYFFRMMRNAWEECAAEKYLKSTFFAMIDAESVRTQYQALSCKGSRESIDGEAPGVYCAQLGFLSSLATWLCIGFAVRRILPRTQVSRSFREFEDRRADAQIASRQICPSTGTGACLVMFIKKAHQYNCCTCRAECQAVEAHSKQAELRDDDNLIADVPTHPDHTSNNSNDLAKAGRTSAAEFVNSGLMRQITMDGSDDICMMPRTFLRKDYAAEAANPTPNVIHCKRVEANLLGTTRRGQIHGALSSGMRRQQIAKAVEENGRTDRRR